MILHRNAPQKKLDLLQLVFGCVAEPGTGPSQIVRRQLRHSDASGVFFHVVPNRPYRHPISPCPPTLLTRRNSLPRSIAAAASQSTSSVLTQSGTGSFEWLQTLKKYGRHMGTHARSGFETRSSSHLRLAVCRPLGSNPWLAPAVGDASSRGTLSTSTAEPDLLRTGPFETLLWRSVRWVSEVLCNRRDQDHAEANRAGTLSDLPAKIRNIRNPKRSLR